MSKQNTNNDTVARIGRANHFVDDVGMKGKLALTKEDLCFATHHMNFKQYTLCMPLDTIASVTLKNNLRFFPYGILVILNTGEKHRFAVWGRKKWVRAITSEMDRFSQKNKVTKV